MVHSSILIRNFSYHNRINPEFQPNKKKKRRLKKSSTLKKNPNSILKEILQLRNVLSNITNASNSKKNKKTKISIKKTKTSINLKKSKNQRLERKKRRRCHSGNNRRKCIYPPPSKLEEDNKENFQDSLTYGNSSITEFEKKEERVSNKFNRYKPLTRIDLSSVRKNFPCYYQEKFLENKNFLTMRSPRIEGERGSLQPKELPMDNTFMGRDFRRKKEKVKKLRKKLGLSPDFSERYAAANIRMKKENRKSVCFTERR